MSDFAPPLVATYRLQLREGVGLDDARALLPWLGELGISHLYLSPLFLAASGSTHGYDVIDPNAVDPALGGEKAFVALADAARAANIGIVLDIVPNHMGFTPENPFIADIMRHGRESRYAGVFDIDWDRGPLHFPVLDGTPKQVLAAGHIAMTGTGDAPALSVYGLGYPLRDTALARRLAGENALDENTLGELLAEQHWSIGDWRSSAGAIVHRRFFNISSLIGVRQEAPEVFDLTHRWIVEQVAAGRIQGLRVDHVDGLARPGGYLHRLRKSVGEVPVWIEKIVKEHEHIPASWPVDGMSGYEFMAPVTQFLTQERGLVAMRDASAGAVPHNTPEEIRAVRRQLLAGDFAPELRRLTASAVAALGCSAGQAPEVTRAIAELATAWPVYRSYTADGYPLDRNASGTCPFSGALLDLLSAAADDPEARVFAARFEQLTGALTAKSEEDTVFYRAVSYLPFCEVGAEPGLQPIGAARFAARMQARARETPLALNALSTHDTKRSADARAAVIALSHFPELVGCFFTHAIERAALRELPARWGVYALQIVLMMRGQTDARERMSKHIAKAMREAKDTSSYERPDEAAERQGAELCGDLATDLGSDWFWEGTAREQFDRIFAETVLAQVALQLTAPGVPDIYQGTETLAIGLTDPDNRRPVDWDGMARLDETTLAGRKLLLTKELLAIRRERPELFTRGEYHLIESEEGWTVRRSWEGEVADVLVYRPGAAKQSAQQGSEHLSA